MYEEIKAYLEKEPRARERHLRDRAMVNLLLNKYPDLQVVTKERIVNFCHDFESYSRIWRKVTEENPALRGLDYDTKEIVEQDKMLSLGYEPGYENNVTQLKML